MSDKIIGGIKEIHQFMGDEGNFLLPYAPAYLRLIQTLDAPEYMDYNCVLCVSGAATRVSWLQGWAAYKDEPNQSELFINGDRLAEYRKGFSGAEMEAEIYLNEAKRDWWSGNYSGSVIWADGSKVKNDIIASIDKGVPVLAHGAAGKPTSLIIGYEDNGTRICLLAFYTRMIKRTVNRSTAYPMKAGPTKLHYTALLPDLHRVWLINNYYARLWLTSFISHD